MEQNSACGLIMYKNSIWYHNDQQVKSDAELLIKAYTILMAETLLTTP